MIRGGYSVSPLGHGALIGPFRSGAVLSPDPGRHIWTDPTSVWGEMAGSYLEGGRRSIGTWCVPLGSSLRVLHLGKVSANNISF